MGFAAPAIALISTGSSLLFGVLRPLISTACELFGVQLAPSMVDITAIAVFGCISLFVVVMVWRRSVPSYL
jgi:hypothetical protein